MCRYHTLIYSLSLLPLFFSSLSLLSYILLEPSSDIYTGVTQQGEKSRGKTTQAEETLGKYVHLTHEAVLKKQEITPSFSRREWIMGANIHWGLTMCNKLLWAWNSLYRHIGTQELRAEISLRNEKESGNQVYHQNVFLTLCLQTSVCCFLVPSNRVASASSEFAGSQMFREGIDWVYPLPLVVVINRFDLKWLREESLFWHTIPKGESIMAGKAWQ